MTTKAIFPHPEEKTCKKCGGYLSQPVETGSGDSDINPLRCHRRDPKKDNAKEK